MSGAPAEVAEPPGNVVLLDARGAVIGEAPRSAVHTTATPRHLAFSLYLFDDAGDLLITRRALGKRTWPGVWTNTCCGHPRPGEDLTSAIRRQLRDDLGIAAGELTCVLPDSAYLATDASGPGSAPAEDGGAVGELDAISDDAAARRPGGDEEIYAKASSDATREALRRLGESLN